MCQVTDETFHRFMRRHHFCCLNICTFYKLHLSRFINPTTVHRSRELIFPLTLTTARIFSEIRSEGGSLEGESFHLSACNKGTMSRRELRESASPLKEDGALGFHNSPRVGRTTTSRAYAARQERNSPSARVQSKHTLQACVSERQKERRWTDMHFLPGSRSAARTICFDIN